MVQPVMARVIKIVVVQIAFFILLVQLINMDDIDLQV